MVNLKMAEFSANICSIFVGLSSGETRTGLEYDPSVLITKSG
jgi:hypothetical protein